MGNRKKKISVDAINTHVMIYHISAMKYDKNSISEFLEKPTGSKSMYLQDIYVQLNRDNNELQFEPVFMHLF